MPRFPWWMMLALWLPCGLSAATLSNEQQERAEALFKEVRCPTCESQSLHDSNSPLASDMRAMIEKQIRSGKTDAQILKQLTDSYGESIVLKPGGDHILLWGAPLISLAAGGLVILISIRNKKKQKDRIS